MTHSLNIEDLKAKAEKAPYQTWAAFTDDSGFIPNTNLVSFVDRTECVLSLAGRTKDDPLVAYLWAAQPAAILELIAQRAELLEALTRISAANPRNTNSATADRMASWTQAVADCALGSVSLRATQSTGEG